jgi:SAM-dependent methyltransferase
MFSESDGYERFMGRWSRRLAPLFVDFAGVKPGDIVLDVGCGTGALTFAAASIPDVHAVGIDRSREFIEVTQRGGSDRVRFRVGDASAPPFADEEFDRALSMLVLNFVPAAATAVREMKRVSRHEGVVAAAVWDYSEGMQMLRAFWDEAVSLDKTAAAHDERHMPLSRPGELTALWREVGLHDVEEAPLEMDMAFASFDDYWKPFLAGQGPAGAYAATLTEPLRETLRTRLCDRLGDSAFTLTARAWAVRGVAI